MRKPYIVCHMMTSLDGRIDCKMTESLPGVEEYYSTLEELNVKTHLSGRNTAEMEMSLPGEFKVKNKNVIDKECFYKATDSDGYEIIADSKGRLLWNETASEEKPLLILTSENASIEYLAYLKERNISWISVGKEKIDLVKACKILANQFNIERMAIVGGGHINGAFLENGLIDEISILIGAGIDGREGMASVFDGLAKENNVIPLHLESVKSFPSGAVWLRYKTLKK